MYALIALALIALNPGDHAEVVSLSFVDAPFATDLFTYIKMAERFAAKDKVGLAKMESDGDIVRLSADTRVLVIKTDEFHGVPPYARIRVSEGKHKDKELLGAQGNLKRVK